MTDQEPRREPPRATEKPAGDAPRRIPLPGSEAARLEQEASPTREPISTQERLEQISRKLDELLARACVCPRCGYIVGANEKVGYSGYVAGDGLPSGKRAEEDQSQ